MSVVTVILLTVLTFAGALLYASVGHGGASGYLAAMALLGVTPEVMKPTALVLNILVAAIATIKFGRAGWFEWKLFWPFAVGSIPFAFIGGGMILPSPLYKPLVGGVLLYAAYRLLRHSPKLTALTGSPPSLWLALLIGVGIGFLSGLTGVGGGIFLSPLILLMGWAEPQQTSGITAPFILANSAAGLLGHVATVATLPSALPLWAIAVMVGGWMGAEYGAQKLDQGLLRRLLALVLLIAGLKMVAMP